MKLLIAGSRNIPWEDAYSEIVTRCRNPECHLGDAEEIVSGTCRGVDEAGEEYARFYGIKIKKFPADWNKYGKSAGPIRNRQMAKYADELLLIWDGKSKGSANMKKEMEKLGKPVHEIIIYGENLDL